MSEALTVLVVDDEKTIREGCRRVLTGKGYAVQTADTGRSCLEAMSRSGADVVLLDLKMPQLSGEEALEILCRDYPQIPVIIITGHGTVDKAVECMKKGAYDFITKPFQIDQFLLAVERAGEKRRLELKARQYEKENIRNLYDLHLEKSRLRTIMNFMANGVMVTNRNMEVVLHNAALMQLMGLTERKKNPFPVSEILQDQELIETIRDIQQGDPAEHRSISLETRAGNNVLRAISAPALDGEGDIVGTVTVLENITAFKQLDRMKTDFVNMVAHELRSPLVSLKQILNVLLEGLAGALAEKQEEFLTRGSSKIDALLELINDLLDVSRIEAGAHIQEEVPTDLEKIIAETVVFMEPRARAKGLRIAYECKDMKPIQADPRGMEEVFHNLIGNAVNYSPNGGEIRIVGRGRGEYLEVSVTDEGIGIPEEELPKIFDKFYRVKDPRTRSVVGTGLGLSIVKGIVEAHRGTIDVESNEGVGTTFRIRLPLSSQAA
ncbi:MAG: response regulator [Deltaproteobacteria bacterium]|nr:response regulator [Deltaproteobacteria bacterium]MBW1948018.1 response regulator [Deltaproteobacteria bacterium]MBW2006947.1 response regulator [Deltaproteobacteria bacterium]MBW2102472.1 response regulator [Deltaproteobacteria bacterium]MBW2346911.1 response regulator [Deltaproteobacteria bacterium]